MAASSTSTRRSTRGCSNLQAVVDGPHRPLRESPRPAALNERASDIHVEPTGEDLRIRYRIDGVLHDISTGPGPSPRPSPPA